MKKIMTKVGLEPAAYMCIDTAITTKLLLLDSTKLWVVFILVAVMFAFYLG